MKQRVKVTAFGMLLFLLTGCGLVGLLQGLQPANPALQMNGKGDVSVAGGTIQFNDSSHPFNGTKITVPSGAFSKPTKIEIRPIENEITKQPLPKGMYAVGTVFEIKTNTGEQPSKQVMLEMPYKTDSISATTNLIVAYYDENAKSWVSLNPHQQNVDNTNQKVSFITTHFSNWRFLVFDVGQGTANPTYRIKSYPPGIEQSSVKNAVSRAVETWDAFLGNVDFQYTESDSADYTFDFSSSPLPQLGITTLEFILAGQRVNILLNTKYSWKVASSNENQSEGLGWDIEAVTLHEFGHAIGLWGHIGGDTNIIEQFTGCPANKIGPPVMAACLPEKPEHTLWDLDVLRLLEKYKTLSSAPPLKIADIPKDLVSTGVNWPALLGASGGIRPYHWWIKTPSESLTFQESMTTVKQGIYPGIAKQAFPSAGEYDFSLEVTTPTIAGLKPQQTTRSFSATLNGSVPPIPAPVSTPKPQLPPSRVRFNVVDNRLVPVFRDDNEQEVPWRWGSVKAEYVIHYVGITDSGPITEQKSETLTREGQPLGYSGKVFSNYRINYKFTFPDGTVLVQRDVDLPDIQVTPPPVISTSAPPSFAPSTWPSVSPSVQPSIRPSSLPSSTGTQDLAGVEVRGANKIETDGQCNASRSAYNATVKLHSLNPDKPYDQTLVNENGSVLYFKNVPTPTNVEITVSLNGYESQTLITTVRHGDNIGILTVKKPGISCTTWQPVITKTRCCGNEL